MQVNDADKPLKSKNPKYLMPKDSVKEVPFKKEGLQNKDYV
jgi:hypothetical protein